MRLSKKTNLIEQSDFMPRMISLLFIGFCVLMMCVTLWQVIKGGSYSTEAVSNAINYNIYHKQSYINLYGAVQRLAGKKAVEDFTIFKNDYDKLIQPQSLLTDKEILAQVEQIKPIADYCNEKGIPFIYLTSILPVQNKTDLPYMEIDFQEENSERLLNDLEVLGISYYDLRSDKGVIQIPKEELFYRTDHHWSLRTCFTVYQQLIRELNQRYGLDINENMIKQDNFESLVWDDAFLGSYGVKIGSYYAGRDDFTVFRPTFDTDLSFESYDTDGNLLIQKDGEWLSCLMNQEILNDPSYDNKYNAWSNSGYVENRVVNHMADNDLKVLYISHSYGRPMTQYFALCFSEVRNLDPQEGRFNGNYLDYIDGYNPDIVVLQGESEGQLYGVYNSTR